MPSIEWYGCNKRAYTVGRKLPISLLVIHATAGSRGSDIPILAGKQEAFKGSGYVSVHYYVQTDGRILQFVREEDTAYHAGVSYYQGATYGNSCNASAIGIEFENRNNGTDQYEPEQLASGIWLAKDIVHRRKLVRARVPMHRDIAPGRKTDCRPPAWNHGRFLDAVFDNKPAPQPIRDERRYAVEFQSCRIRQGPGTTFAEAGRMGIGDEFVADSIKFGQIIEGSDEWLHLADGRGFIHISLVSRTG